MVARAGGARMSGDRLRRGDPAPSFFYLQQELLLAEEALAIGLTALRNGTLTNRGALYVGFFELSIALERILKVILIIDFMHSHRLAYPDSKLVTKYGHNLVRLYNAVRRLGGGEILAPLAEGSVSTLILRFLSRFAKSSRYYNLDALTESATGSDPLEEWHEILRMVIERDVPATEREKVRTAAEATAALAAGRVIAIVHDLSKRQLDEGELFLISALEHAAAPYVALRVFEIIGPTRALLAQLGHRAYLDVSASGDGRLHIPYTPDFMRFATADRKTILRKKRWP
jgi:hypothetical protein